MEPISAKLPTAPNLRQSAGEEEIKQQEEVSALMRLHTLGWSIHKISQALGMSRITVRKYLRNGGVVKYERTYERKRALQEHEEWLREKFFRHAGNADVIRQELESEKGVTVSLRTVERAVRPYREELRRVALVTVRFETPPGRQMQIDFGEKRVLIGGERVQVHFFVAKLGYSRRLYVRAFEHENQYTWFQGMEGAFAYFGGVPEEVLTDNPRALVTEHNRATRELKLNERFKAFSEYWGFLPRACAPLRARTKGKVESGVGYVKRNCIAGREFTSWEDMERHIAHWLRMESDGRELKACPVCIPEEHKDRDAPDTPLLRFELYEQAALKSVEGRAPFVQVRELVRKVSSDSLVDVDTNRYSVPWAHVGKQVRVHVTDTEVIVCHGGEEVARHARCAGRHQRITTAEHYSGVLYCAEEKEADVQRPVMGKLDRSLSEYEEAVSEGSAA